jgi:GntR family transcriptional regulator/MocR family aminotransferase
MRISFDQISRPPQRALVSPNGRKTRWQGAAAALRAQLAAGRFAPDEPLPSTRELARELGLHRHTLMIALDALVAEGLLRVESRRGYFVCPAPAELIAPQPSAALDFAGFRLVRGGRAELREALPAPVIRMHAALPDTTLLPLGELRAAYAHVLKKRGSAALGEVAELGLPALRRELTRYVRRARGFVPQTLFVTHGSQEALALAAQVLLRPGDCVLMEEPGYPQAAAMFRALNAKIVPLPVDAQGLRIDALTSALARHTPRLLYTTPNHHYPTTVTLSAPRRAALLQLTSQHNLPIVEDDYDHEYHYRGAPQPPLAASGARHVLYVATLSKLVAPSLRVGFACGDPALINAMVRVRGLFVRGQEGVTQSALSDWMSDGGLDRHLRRARRVYAQRRDLALASLARAQAEVPFELTPPNGGLAIWSVWPEHDVSELAERAAARGVWVLPETMTSLKQRGHGLRLAFGAITPAQFEAGVAVLVEEAKRSTRRRKRSARS